MEDALVEDSDGPNSSSGSLGAGAEEGMALCVFDG